MLMKFFEKLTDDLVSLCVFDSDFVSERVKYIWYY